MTYKNIAVSKEVHEMVGKIVKEHKNQNPDQMPLSNGLLVSNLIRKEHKRICKGKG